MSATFSINFNEPLFVFVDAVFVLLGMGQTMHVFLCWFLASEEERRRSAAFAVRICYETSIVVIIVFTSMCFEHYDVVAVRFLGASIPIEALCCTGLLPVGFGLALCALGGGSRALLAEAILFASAPAAVLMGSGVLYLASIAVVGTWLVYRIIANFLGDAALRSRTLTRFSIVDAVNLLPTGVLCLTRRGQSLIMNGSMRQSLVDLDLPIDVADLSNLWAALSALALSDGRSFKYSEDCLLIAMPDGTYNLFERGVMNWNGAEHLTITAVDVTEEAELNRLLERSNDLIVAAGEEIKASLEDVARVAQNEALLSLRAKVHDIIGQRLSILHRLLEDDNITDESLDLIKPLLNNLLDDLRIEAFEARAELEGIVSAFALIDVRLEVEGVLPERESVARAFVTVIREATTNAVRHAQASVVRVGLAASEGEWALSVSNDCAERRAPSREGIGIPNMRKAVESLGGTLEVSKSPRFVVSARVPKSGGGRSQ